MTMDVHVPLASPDTPVLRSPLEPLVGEGGKGEEGVQEHQIPPPQDHQALVPIDLDDPLQPEPEPEKLELEPESPPTPRVHQAQGQGQPAGPPPKSLYLSSTGW